MHHQCETKQTLVADPKCVFLLGASLPKKPIRPAMHAPPSHVESSSKLIVMGMPVHLSPKRQGPFFEGAYPTRVATWGACIHFCAAGMQTSQQQDAWAAVKWHGCEGLWNVFWCLATISCCRAQDWLAVSKAVFPLPFHVKVEATNHCPVAGKFNNAHWTQCQLLSHHISNQSSMSCN